MRTGFKGSRTIVVPSLIINQLLDDDFIAKLHITDIGHFPSASLHEVKREEGIPQYLLIYCISGEGWYEINHVRHELKMDQLIVLPADTPHAYGSSKNRPWTIYWIHFAGELAGYYANTLRKPVTINPCGVSRISDRINIFEDIFSALKHGFNRENMAFASSALYYFLGSIKFIHIFRSADHPENADNDKGLIDGVLKYIHESIEKRLTLKDLCQYIDYSESYFLTLFKAHTGTTPNKYIIKLKMERACELLETTDMKINQVCQKIAIPDPYHFSKIFAKSIGMSPTAYKKKMHKLHEQNLSTSDTPQEE
ncbi:MAG: AraC family transcriptional regulator [Rikenellaceae bacterium]